MTPHSPREIYSVAEDEAAIWLARLDGGELSLSEREKFEKWRQARRENQVAFDSLSATWKQMGQIAALLADSLDDGSKPVLRRELSDNARRKERTRSLATAAAVIVLIGSVWFLRDVRHSSHEQHTDVGEVRVVELTDGSSMTLGTDSRVSVEYSERQRRVEVRTGEVFFAVSPDAQRPFLVSTVKGDIKAVGTAFNVRVRRDEVDVLVEEGQVELALTNGDEPNRGNRRLVSQHQRSELASHVSAPQVVSPTEMRRLLSWREGRIYFDDEPLSDAVREVERFTNKRIFVASKELEDLRIGGVYKIGDVEGFVSALEDLFPVAVVRITPYVSFLVADEQT
jgi:transmembrane sensor